MNLNRCAGLVSAILVAALAGCGETGKEVSPNQAVNPPSIANDRVPDPCAVAGAYERDLEELLTRYAENHPDVIRLRRLVESANAVCAFSPGDGLPKLEDYMTQHDLPSGKWRERDGVRVCDGYMTRFADQDYCSAEVPEDWVPFSFNGQRYYIQRLNGSDDK